jgi:signal transduction histidine kinase
VSGGGTAAAPCAGKTARQPLAELLHALNQPLTGLQCSLEVTLAASRTGEHYQKTLRDGLALTERMRLLVEALREVADSSESASGAASRTFAGEMNAARLQAEIWEAWREAAEGLTPVADMKQVTISLKGTGGWVRSSSDRDQQVHPAYGEGIFRLLDAIVALAECGTVIEARSDTHASGFCVRWRGAADAEKNYAPLSRPEIGLLVARARLEQLGAEWERQRTQEGEAITVRLSVGLAE